MVFLALRQQLSTIQAIVQVNPNTISKQMVKWVAGLDLESIVLVEGKVQQPQVPVESTSVKEREIAIEKVRLASQFAYELSWTHLFLSEDISRIWSCH